MRTYKLKIMQNIKQWYSMPMEVEIEASDAATAITLAWHQANQKGIIVNKILLTQNSTR